MKVRFNLKSHVIDAEMSDVPRLGEYVELNDIDYVVKHVVWQPIRNSYVDVWVVLEPL